MNRSKTSQNDHDYTSETIKYKNKRMTVNYSIHVYTVYIYIMRELLIKSLLCSVLRQIHTTYKYFTEMKFFVFPVHFSPDIQ